MNYTDVMQFMNSLFFYYVRNKKIWKILEFKKKKNFSADDDDDDSKKKKKRRKKRENLISIANSVNEIRGLYISTILNI